MPSQLAETIIALTKVAYRLSIAEEITDNLKRAVSRDIFDPIEAEAKRKFGTLHPDSVARMRKIFLENLPSATSEEIDAHLQRMRSALN